MITTNGKPQVVVRNTALEPLKANGKHLGGTHNKLTVTPEAISCALKEARSEITKPSVIIADTIKGRGVYLWKTIIIGITEHQMKVN